ncbi:MAG: hypothetical protein REI45_14095, partial [Propionicimonas sp.]|nr:hypothetical protein [Propionicimonas sp.]
FAATALTLLAPAVGARVAPARSTEATFRDSTAVQVAVASSRYGTEICVIQSREARSDIAFTIASNAPLGDRGWTNIVDKTAATATADLEGCDVVMIAGEAWGVQTASRDLALAWARAGGSVLSTGNDSRPTTLPELIGSDGETVADVYPFGGSVPADPSVRSALVPAYPMWTPSAAGTYTIDTSARPILSAAAGAVCVGSAAGYPEWCAALARTWTSGGRWVHLHTKIGSLESPGEVPGADAALAWLAIGRS